MVDALKADEIARQSVYVPLAMTVAMQTLTAYALYSSAVYAPIVAPDLGLEPERVSIYVMFAYFSAMVAGLACSGIIKRFGPLRTVQIGLLFSGVGLVSGTLGVAPLLIATATLIGFGNGLTGPVSSHILVERCPRHMLSLVLSAKQTGVPIGGAIAGATIPLVALALGWRYSLLIAACVYLVAILMMQRFRVEYDVRRSKEARLSLAGVFREMRVALRMTWAHPRLRQLSMACFGFVTIQWIVFTFMVSLLFGLVGSGMFTYGWKMGRMVPLGAGVVMMVATYLIPNALVLVIVCCGLSAVPWVIRE